MTVDMLAQAAFLALSLLSTMNLGGGLRPPTRGRQRSTKDLCARLDEFPCMLLCWCWDEESTTTKQRHLCCPMYLATLSSVAKVPSSHHFCDLWRNDVLHNHVLCGSFVSWKLQALRAIDSGYRFSLGHLHKRYSHSFGRVRNELRDEILESCKVQGVCLRDLSEFPVLFTMSLPRMMLSSLTTQAENILVTPSSFTSTAYASFDRFLDHTNVSHMSQQLVPERIGPRSLSEPEIWKSKQSWFQRGAGWQKAGAYSQWGPSFHVSVARLGFFLQNLEDFRCTCIAAAKVTSPGVDVSSMAFPSKPMIYRNMVKLDWLSMLWERVKRKDMQVKGTRYSINIILDCSPQGHHDFLIMIEELFVRKSQAPQLSFDPLGGV